MAKKQIYVFLILTFFLTYLFDFLAFLKLGPIKDATNSEWVFYLSAQMPIPTLCVFLSKLIFKEKINKSTAILFGFYFLISTWAFVRLFYDPVIFNQSQNGVVVSITVSMIGLQIISFLGALFIIVANFKKNLRGELGKFKLSFGENKKYYLISLGILSVALVPSVFLNRLFNLGSAALRYDPVMFVLSSVLAIAFAPISNWAYFLGEEYAWRVYLQDKLLPIFGNKKGVLLLGTIWGLWHAPVIALGYNYPGQPVLGIVCMVIFTIALGIIYGWAVMKTKSVWSAVWLHLATNNLIGLGAIYLSQAENPILSFGIGIYGLALLAIASGTLLFKTKEYALKS